VTIPSPPLDPNLTVQQILAEPAFRNVRAGDASPSGWDQFWAWLGQQIGQLLRGFIGAVSGDTGRLIGDLLFGAAIVGIIVVVCYLLLAFAASRARGPLVSEPDLADARRAPNLIGLAQAAADEGDYARAIAMLFSASLAIFDEKGVVAYDATRTAWEYERLLRARSSDAITPFRQIVRAFVGIAFAAGRATRADYEEARGAVASIQAAAA
jgi:hypothetical protein